MTEEISQETSSNVYIKINISDNVDYTKNTININMSYIESIPKDEPVATICEAITEILHIKYNLNLDIVKF